MFVTLSGVLETGSVPLRPVRIILTNLKHFFRDREIVITVNSHSLIVDRFEYTQNHIANKNYEPEVTTFLKENIQSGDNLVDVGANVGYFTTLMAGLTTGDVLAFEPHPDNYRRLLNNINLNRLRNIRAHPVAISSSNGKTSLAVTPYNQGGNFVLNKSDRTHQGLKLIEVQMRTLDTFCQDKPIHGIKIDVEGHELEVLQGMKDIFNQHSLRFLVIETKGRCAQITEFMKRENFIRVDLKTGNQTKSIDENDLNSVYIRE